ncbi:MAG: hypothetical protein ACWA5W_06740 [Phycisphaerales bacterium]
MILTTVIGAMTLAALGPNQAIDNSKNTLGTPEIIEIRADMINNAQTRRGQIRYSNNTQGTVVATASNGQAKWDSADRERLGGQDAPELIYVQIFDGIFAIDPFSPLPAANDSTAQMLFRSTTLETDRSQYGRQEIERTKELFRKLEQARQNWLHDNGYYGVKVITNPNAPTEEQQAKVNKLPEPSAVFERPADVPRIKSREQVKVDDHSGMSGVVAMFSDDEPIRISLPHNVSLELASRVEKINERQETTKVAIDR